MKVSEDDFQRMYERTQAAIRRGYNPGGVPPIPVAEAGDQAPRAPSPKPELPAGDAPSVPPASEKAGSGRFHVRIESRRVRLCDPDNLTPKFLIDCLRYAGAIPEDNPDSITLQVSQTKVRKFADEETIITIEKVEGPTIS